MPKKTVLITGGSRGIGLETARLCVSKGLGVVLLARDADALAAARDELIAGDASPSDVEITAHDLADSAGIAACIDRIESIKDGLWGLVNNAAVEILKPLPQLTPDDLDQTWRVNMLAPILTIQACYPMLRAAGGSVVNVSSIADFEAYPAYSLYGASKAFLQSFSRHASKELGFEGIRINIVSPGGVDTPLMRKVLASGVFEKAEIDREMAAIPIEQRWATAQEVAETIYFALAGPRYLHGADLRIHGGCGA